MLPWRPAASVFISYRRIDTQQAAGRLADHLMDRFGRQAVVIDVDTDQVGRDYREVVAEHLEVAHVVLALIGPRFMDLESDGKRRLDRPDDLLRLELTRALQRGVPVVPVLVDGAELPDPDDLPSELRPLVYRGSLELAHARFRDDYARLERAVERFLNEEAGPISEATGSRGTEESERSATDEPDGETTGASATPRAPNAAETKPVPMAERTLVVTWDEAYLGARKTLTVGGERRAVAVPAGVVDGQRLTVEAAGEPGAGDARDGTLHVTVTIEAHPDFDRHGDDLVTEQTVSRRDALDGATVQVGVPGGHVEVEIPPGASNGESLRVPGAGFPNATSGVHGDLVVTLRIDPQDSSPPEEEGSPDSLVAEHSAVSAPPEPQRRLADLAAMLQRSPLLAGAIAAAAIIAVGMVALLARSPSDSNTTAGDAPGGATDSSETAVSAPVETTAVSVTAPPVGGPESTPAGGGGLVCVVTDLAGVDDAGFNSAAWEGAQRAANELGAEARVLESSSTADYEVNVESFIDDGCDLIITAGFLLRDATLSAAQDNPDVDFAVVDWAEEAPPPNLRGLVFKVEEAAFLAGYAAAGMTETGRVGTFGGLDIPPITSYMDGFARGVEHHNREKGTTVETLGWDPDLEIGSFTYNFESLDDGRAFAQSLADEGADVIMPVAGPVGLGASALASELGTFLVIGVDRDWTVVDPDNAAVVLTSAVKQIANAVYATAVDALNGNHTNASYVGTLANDGVAISPNNFDTMVPDELRTEVEAVRHAIVSGVLEVGS